MIARWFLLVTVLVASAFGVAVPTLATLPDDVRPGTRVEVKGRLMGPRALVAELIEIDLRPGGDDELGGVIESVDAPGKALTAVGIRIAISDATVLEGESRQPVVFGDFKRGQWISVDGTLGEDGILRASEVCIKTSTPERMRQTKLEGRVRRVDAARSSFVLLGATVTVTPQTQITRVTPVERRAGAKAEGCRPQRQGQVMRVAFRPSAAAAARLTGKAPLDQKGAITAITEAEKEVTRRFRENVVPRLWQTAAAAPLGERMYEYVAQNPLGEAREHTALSPEDLGRIRRTLTKIHRKRAPEPREAPSGQLALTLEDAVGLALEENLRVKITQLNEEALETEIPRARAVFHPLLGTALTASREKTVTDGRRTGDVSTRTPTAFISENVPTGGNILIAGDFTRKDTSGARPPREYNSNYSVSVVQPLLRGGRIYVATRPIKDAEYNWRIAAAQLQADILTVTAQTKAAYYDAVLAEKIIDVTQEAIARDEALIEASDALFKAGLVTKRDVFSAAILRADDEERLVTARGDRELAQNILSDVLGVSIGTEVQLRDEAIDFEPISLDLATWIALANERRPEILAAGEAVKRSALDVRVADNTLLPQVDVLGSYGRGETGTSIGNALNFRGDAWKTGLVFSYPLGNVAARSALSRAKLEHARFELELAQTRRQVELQVRAAVIKLRTNLERMKPLAVSVEQSEGKLEVAQARFALGQATNKDVTDAQESILKAERDLLRATVDYKTGLAELESSIAGQI